MNCYFTFMLSYSNVKTLVVINLHQTAHFLLGNFCGFCEVRGLLGMVHVITMQTQENHVKAVESVYLVFHLHYQVLVSNEQDQHTMLSFAKVEFT